MFGTILALVLILTTMPLSPRAQSVTSHRATAADAGLPAYQLIFTQKLPAESSEATAAWTLAINVTGGLTGVTKRQLILSSDGYATIDGPDGSSRTTISDGVSELDRLVQDLDTSTFKTTLAMPISFCADCFRTTLSLYRLEYRTDGRVRVGYKASWDEATEARVSEPVLNIYRLASRIAQTASGGSRSRDRNLPK